MVKPPRGIIFSDVDGTFLDGTFRPAMDRAAFARVLEDWRVVWVSSRTADELLHLQAELGHTDDAIGENGGVVVTRDETLARALGEPRQLRDAWIARLAAPRDETAAAVRRAFAVNGLAARTFDELDAGTLAELSGYTRVEAERALHRDASVVLTNVDPSDTTAARALAWLRDASFEVAHGGKWVSVVDGANKGEAAFAWLAATRDKWKRPPVVAAVGNQQNDATLLAVAEHRFVIDEPGRGHCPPLAALPGARLLTRAGTSGWLEMCEHLAALNGRAHD